MQLRHCCLHTNSAIGKTEYTCQSDTAEEDNSFGLCCPCHYNFVKTMEIDFIFRIAAIGIIVSVLNQLLIRSGREDQAMMTTLAGLIVVLMMVVSQVSVLFDTVKDLFDL